MSSSNYNISYCKILECTSTYYLIDSHFSIKQQSNNPSIGL